jgi:hypothetical protein
MTPHPTRTRFWSRRVVIAAIALVWAVTACGEAGSPEDGSVDRATFVDSWVELRRAALASPTGQVPTAERDRILAERGVTQEQLLAFAEAHGADVAYMKKIWDEVAARLRPEVPSPDDSGASPGRP